MGFTLKNTPGLTGANVEVEEENVEVEESDGELSISDRARLIGQGLSLNYGDEATAGIRSFLSKISGGELTFDEAVEEERKLVETARKKAPGESLALEIGGAAIPSLATLVFSGGTTLPLITANIAKIGAQYGLKGMAKTIAKGTAEGAVAATGAQEGDLQDRILTSETALGAGAGGALGPLFQGVVKGIGAGGKKILNLDVFRKNFGGLLGKAESDELARIIQESNIEPEEIIRRVSEGEVIADMSPELAMSLRALYSTAGKGRGEIADVLSKRATSLPNRAASTIQKTLSPEKEKGNILDWFGRSTKQLKDAEGDEYKKVFDGFKDDLNPSATGVLYSVLNRQVVELLQQQENLRPAIINLIQTSKQAPLFKVTKAGKVELLRDVDLETAEIIRRSLNDQTTAAFNKGEGALGTALGDLEKTLRKTLDDASPELAKTRARWAKIMARSDAFEQGKKILSKSADEVEIIFNDLAEKGDDEAIAALRAGYASALRNKRTVGSQATLFRDLNDLDKKQRMILETIFPGDDLNKAINQINLADRALKTANRVLGGSPTAPQRAAESKIGTMSLAANVADMFLRPMSAPFAAMRILRDIVGTKLDNLSAEQRTEVAKMLVSEDPEILEKMLTDKTVLAKLSQKYNEMIDAFGTAARRGTATTTSADLEREDSRAIKAIVQGATPKTKEKLRAIGVK